MLYKISDSAKEIKNKKALKDLTSKIKSEKPEEKARRLFIKNDFEVLVAYDNDLLIKEEAFRYTPVLVGKWKKYRELENVCIRVCNEGIALVYHKDDQSYSYRWSGIKYSEKSKFRININGGINKEMMKLTDELIIILEAYKK